MVARPKPSQAHVRQLLCGDDEDRRDSDFQATTRQVPASTCTHRCRGRRKIRKTMTSFSSAYTASDSSSDSTSTSTSSSSSSKGTSSSSTTSSRRLKAQPARKASNPTVRWMRPADQLKHKLRMVDANAVSDSELGRAVTFKERARTIRAWMLKHLPGAKEAASTNQQIRKDLKLKPHQRIPYSQTAALP